MRSGLLCIVLFTGCSMPSLRPARQVAVLEPTRVGQATLQVFEGSRVAVNGEVLSVDAPDGFRWSEFRWLEAPVGPAVTAWSVEQCDGLIWERMAAPMTGVQTRTGLCTRQGQEYWTFLALEERGGRTLMTTWLGHRESLPYEDAWVEITTTALSLTGSDTPFEFLDADALRERMRRIAPESTGPSPVPGGGELGAAISEALAESWARRLAEPAPDWTTAPTE